MLTSISPGLLRLRTHYLLTLAWGTIILGGIGAVPVILGSLQRGTPNVIGLGIVIGAIVLNSVWVILISRKNFISASYGVLFTLLAVYLFAPIDILMITGTLVVITTAVIAGRNLYWFVNVLVLLRILVEITRLVTDNPGVFPPGIYNLTLPLFSFALISVVTRYFLQSSQNSAIEARRSADALGAATTIGRQIVQQIDSDEIMRRTVNFIRDRFAFYHVQVFLLNETGDQAVLRASTGDIGYQLLQRRHQITVGSQSVVGQAVLRGASVLVANTSREAVYFHNELLPNTRSEFTIPLKDGDRVFGTLDIQSTIPNSITEIDRQALEVIGDLLALSLRDARLLTEQARLRSESTRLTTQSRTLSHDNERLNREITRTTWGEYLGQRSEIRGVDLQNDEVIQAAGWSVDLAHASEQGETVNAHGVIAVPVILRGEVIGAIEVERGASTAAETMEIAQAVAQRLAISLESARLYEVTRQAAYQEQQINEIVARYGTTASIDELLRITLTQLGETLGAQGGSIRLGRVDNGGSAP